MDSIDLQRRIDELADRFEREVREKRDPSIEEYLARAPREAREVLVRELLMITFQRKTESNEPIHLERFVARFPSYEQTVREAGRLIETLGAASTQDVEPTIQNTLAGAPKSPDGATATIGGYEIECELGRGGMGVVYKAWDTRLRRPVALKLIREQSLADDALKKRFQREAETVARFQHPGIVQIYDVGEHAGSPYCAFEFVEGKSLDKEAPKWPLPASEAARVVAEVAEAIEYAHQRGVVHRDLKPGNILISASGSLKVVDFGLAKQLDAETLTLTNPGAILGTPSYMAPEQASSDLDAIGPATDVFSLGAILYQLVSGKLPFRGKTFVDTLDGVRFSDPAPLPDDVPNDLASICLKCMAKAPNDRYASAAALQEDLNRFISKEPVHAVPPPPMPRRRDGKSNEDQFGELLRFEGHLKGVTGIAVSPDASRIASTSLDGTTRIWDRATGEELHLFQHGRSGRCVAFLSNQKLTVGGGSATKNEGFLLLADVSTGRIEDVFPSSDVPSSAHRIVVSPATTMMVVITMDGRVFHVLPDEGQIGQLGPDGATCADFSPDGCELAVGRETGDVVVWNLASGQIRATMKGLSGRVHCISYSRDGCRLVFGGEGLRLRPIAPGPIPHAHFPQHVNATAATFAEDDRCIVSADPSGAVSVWSTDDCALIRRFSGQAGAVTGIIAIPGERHVITSSLDGVIRVWGLPKIRDSKHQTSPARQGKSNRPERLCAEIQGHHGKLTSLAFSPNGRLLLSTSMDDTVRVWDASDYRPIQSLEGHQDIAWQARFLVSDDRLVSVGQDNSVRIWSTFEGHALAARNSLPYPVNCVDVHPQYDLFVTGDDGGKLRFWSFRDNLEETSVLEGHSDEIWCVDISRNGRFVASGGKDRSIRVWSIKDGKEILRIGHGWLNREKPTHAVLFSPDGQFFFAAGSDRRIRRFAVESGKCLQTLVGHEREVKQLAWDHLSERLVSVSDDGAMAFWDLQNGSCDRLMTRPPGTVRCLAVSPDGHLAATATADALIRLWDLRATSTISDG